MGKSHQVLISFLVLVIAVLTSLFWLDPLPDMNPGPSSFSVSRAMEHVDAIAQQPHYVGSPAHSKVRNYIAEELEQLGLVVQTQSGFSLNSEGIATYPENILARIEGTEPGKALLIMTHYDSAMHSSYGASDAGSGIATILEGIRAYLESGRRPLHDVIILFTDAEELGLNGAELFVEEHPWAKEVGVALNFEARGSGGNSFMLLETEGGNRALLEHFSKADVPKPVTNSLAYSVYKMLPNDTDLTVLRERGGIPGYNFAFIDDHFDYHTANDTPRNLDRSSLAHQGSYILSLLNYFSARDLTNMKAEEDQVFFNFPLLHLISYPFGWIVPLLVGTIIIFVLTVSWGLYMKKLRLSLLLQTVLLFALLLLVVALLGLGLYKFLYFIYPGYGEIEQGFPYNGHVYLAAASLVGTALCCYGYSFWKRKFNSAELFVPVLFYWILIGALASLYLPGASYLILLPLMGVIQLGLLLKFPGRFSLVQVLLVLPAVFILVPLIRSFPVALGLQVLFLGTLLTALLWGLLWPLFSFLKKLQLVGFLFFLGFVGLLLIAHFQSEFSPSRPKPNSLVYLMDLDHQKATWNTYDGILDEYNRPYFPQDLTLRAGHPSFSSKYGTAFTRSAPAKEIPLAGPYVHVEKVGGPLGDLQQYVIEIAPRRTTNRMDLYTSLEMDFDTFTVNGQEAELLQPGRSDLHVFKNRWDERLLTYYPKNRDTLRLQVGIPADAHPQISLYATSYDLLSHEHLDVEPRKDWMIPRPFVINDAIIIKKEITLE